MNTMTKRFQERIPARIDAIVTFRDRPGKAVIENISNYGMLIQSNVPIPDSVELCEVRIPWQKEEFSMSVVIVRVLHKGTESQKIGVELTEPEARFIHFVSTLQFFYTLA